MSLEADYNRAKTAMFRNKSVPISHHQRLQIYGLFRQAEVGDVKGPKPKEDNIIAFQKYLEHVKHKGVSQDEAKKKYIDLTVQILKKELKKDNRDTIAARPIPQWKLNLQARKGSKPLGKPQVSTRKRTKTRKRTNQEKQNTFDNEKKTDTIRSVESEEEAPPPLPVVKKPTQSQQDRYSRQQVFRSRHFSSVSGVNNPLNDHEDVAKKYELYEKIRCFYAKHDPAKVKKGLGVIVEWTMAHGESALNENLKQKFGHDMKDMETEDTKEAEQHNIESKERRETQMILSRKFLQTKDAETRKKMDKLTRFLLVNDPELVSRGMFLLIKFIEAKGLGALNQNLKKNYGKSLDSVSEDELNTELKAKYGNDLGMLNSPLFGANANEPQSRKSMLETTLEDQLLEMDPEIIRKTQLEKLQENKKGNKKSQRPSVRMVERTGVESFDDRAYMETLSSKPQFTKDYKAVEPLLRTFLEKYEPYRFEQAFTMISDYCKKHGVKELNKKLKNKYDVDLDSFQTLSKEMEANMSDEEFNVRVLQFVSKHEKPKNVEKALKAMTDYRRRQGMAALNTKLYVKYGETLNDVMDDGGQRTERGLSMAQIHSIELDENIKEKLKSYYAKYDPMILGNGVDKIIEWAETNGQEALDRQLKSKYKQSLTEFIKAEEELKKELEEFYKKMDNRKLSGNHVTSVLSWAVVNGRDALNYNLRRKYNFDLDALRGSDISQANGVDI